MTEVGPIDTTPALGAELTTAGAARGPLAAVPSSADAQLMALYAELRRAEADHDAAARHLDMVEGTQAEAAAGDAVDAAFAACDALTRRMAALPAEGAPGLAAKAARLVVAVLEGRSTADLALAASVARDAARLAPEVAA